MNAYLSTLLATTLLFGAVPLASADNDKTPASPSYKADNTGTNTRDRSGDRPTPMDQSSSKADTEVTAYIRKALVGDSSLSVNAQNVKVITANGRITLRGPVKNEMERNKVIAMAKKHAAGRTVINDLEISAP